MSTQLPATRTVACPRCGESTDVAVPDEDVTLVVRQSVAAFGDHERITCSNDHTYWVYRC